MATTDEMIAKYGPGSGPCADKTLAKLGLESGLGDWPTLDVFLAHLANQGLTDVRIDPGTFFDGLKPTDDIIVIMPPNEEGASHVFSTLAGVARHAQRECGIVIPVPKR